MNFGQNGIKFVMRDILCTLIDYLFDFFLIYILWKNSFFFSFELMRCEIEKTTRSTLFIYCKRLCQKFIKKRNLFFNIYLNTPYFLTAYDPIINISSEKKLFFEYFCFKFIKFTNFFLSFFLIILIFLFLISYTFEKLIKSFF